MKRELIRFHCFHFYHFHICLASFQRVVLQEPAQAMVDSRDTGSSLGREGPYKNLWTWWKDQDCLLQVT